jgi:CheY-like chemotaxis protein
MSKAVIVLVTRRERLAEVRSALATSAMGERGADGAVEATTARHAGEPALAREIAAAHRRLPSHGVVVVVDDAREELAALASGADEVVTPASLASLGAAIERARLRAAARDREAPDGRVLGQVLSNVVRRLEAPTTALTLDLESFRATSGPAGEPGQALEALEDCGAALEDMSEALRDAALFTRAEELERPAPVDVADLVEQVLRVLGGPVGLEAVIERTHGPGAPLAHAPRGKLARAVAAAVVHALASAALGAPEGALRRLRVGVHDERGDAVLLEIEALTNSIGAGERRPVEPEGALSRLRDRLRELECDLRFERAEGSARLSLTLPREPIGELGLGRVPTSRLRVPTRPRVLLIDPDDRVLRATSRALGDAYEVFVARNGEEAIDAARELELSAIVVNVRLPDVTASLLIEELRRARGSASAKIVLVAGQGELDRLDGPLGDARIDKPIRRAELLGALEGQLARRASSLPGRSSPVLN